MIRTARFVIRGDANRAQPTHRALVFADAATGAPRGIDERLLQAHVHLDLRVRRWRLTDLGRGFERESVLGVGDDAVGARRARKFASIVARSETPRLERRAAHTHGGTVDGGEGERAVAHGFIDHIHVNCLRGGGAVFLADDAWPLHGPGQAAATIDVGEADAHRALRGVVAGPELFLERERPDSGRRARLAAGDAVELAAAGANAVVEDRRPDGLPAVRETRGLEHVGRADAHAFAALEAAREKLLFGYGTRRTDEAG